MTEEHVRKPIRIAAVGDLHCTKASVGSFAPWLATVNERADVLLLCGDLTDYGLHEEVQVLVKELSTVRVPMLAVLGNHDYETGSEADVAQQLTDAGVQVLSGETAEVQPDGSFSKTIQVSQEGFSFVEVEAVDERGNQASEQRRVFFDTSY